MAKRAPKKWIKGAVKRPGAFTSYCKSKGMGGNIQKCARITVRSRTASTHRKKQAQFALRMGSLARERKK